MSDRTPADSGGVGALVSVVASLATAVLVLVARPTWHTVLDHPTAFASFAAVTIALQLLQVEVYGRGRVSVAGIGALACGFALGVGPAMAVQVVSGLVNAVVTRSKVNRALFNVATLALAAGAGVGVERLLTPSGIGAKIAAAVAGGVTFWAINIGLLTLVMGLDERRSLLDVWRERFRWLTGHYLSFGPLALASTLAYEKVGLLGIFAFVLPPALLVLSVRQYLNRTRASVEDVRQANEELSIAVAELALRNDDLHRLFEFAGSLAARTHDRDALVAYGQEWLALVTGGGVRIGVGDTAPGIPLVSGGTRVGGVVIDELPTFQRDRWERLAETVLPQLATALESANLVEEVRRTHLATIAALSRSMEAKDYYTGGHTERVAEFAVAIARRLGYSGADLDAIEIGALLHDIGKIGIPERILHKPGPLDEEEQRVMREHPVISASILKEADLPEIVLQIARHHHERLDGAGYPDRLRGDGIPLPARIVLVADAFDALTSDRPYRRGRHAGVAIEALRDGVGTQFCPIVVEALEEIYAEEPHLLGTAPLRALEVA